MTNKYEIVWMTANHATASADGVEDAVAKAMQMKKEGKIRIVGICDIRVKDCRTGETAIVAVDKDYKVVKVHELD